MKSFSKKMILGFTALITMQTAIAQNTLNGGVDHPLTPTNAPIINPAPCTDGMPLNLTRTFMPYKAVSNETHYIFDFGPTASSGSNYCAVKTEYMDGWSNVVQTILKGTANDLVSIKNTRSSLTTNDYLSYPVDPSSYFQNNAFGEDEAYYVSKYPEENKRSYNQTIVSYPSGVRTVESYVAGGSFVGNHKGTTVTTEINDGTENVIIYSVSGTGVVNSGYYPAERLIVKTTSEIQHNTVKEFLNNEGQLICSRVLTGSGTPAYEETYYIYNGLGQLSYLLTPLGSKRLATTGEPFENAVDLFTSFKYDVFGDLIEKHIPGQNGVNAYLYDKKRRVVLSQSPGLRSRGLFKFQLYDARGRVVISGLYTDSRSYADIQADITTPPSSPEPGSLFYYIANRVSGTYPVSITDCQIDQYFYYDTYQLPCTFNTSYASETGVGEGYENAYVPSMVTNGLLTGTIIRVKDDNSFPISTDHWVSTNIFYDAKGQVIQIQSLNPKAPESLDNCLAGTSTLQKDIEYIHYDYTGNKVLDITDHYDPTCTAQPYTKVYTKFVYDYTNNARLLKVTQRLNDGMEIPLSYYFYNALGQVSEKVLGNAVEIQNYDYNIRGQLAAINRDYTNSECSSQGTTATFGCILSYDYDFNTPRYDGSLSGMRWRGASHTTPLRSYGYEYDGKNQLTHAEFREFSNSYGAQGVCGSPFGLTWNKTHTDFTVANISYDVNGNILHMDQRGNSFTGPVDMDLLTYTYVPWSNQVDHITDNGVVDPFLPDFKDIDPSLVTSPDHWDYLYDDNGNLVKDLNKDLMGIDYNENDQPVSVVFGSSSITNVYTADGRLVSKKVQPASGAPYTYTYGAGLTYKSDGTNDVPQYMLHSEGRARYDAASNLFTYDYFVKDHLGNVRTVVTGNMQNVSATSSHGDDETYPAPHGMMRRSYTAGYEPTDAEQEKIFFTHLDEARDARPAYATATDQYSARLNASDSSRIISTSILLSVVPGDTIDANVDGYYDDTTTVGYKSSSDMMGALLSTLVGINSTLAVGAGESGTGGALLPRLDGINKTDYDAYDVIVSDATDPDAPRAYLNYLFFDERMVFHPELSGAIQVSKEAGKWSTIGTGRIKIEHAGYIEIHLSNSGIKDVYFDGVSVNVYHGTLLQENHYYPFGLALNMGESISAVKNRFKYQGKELQEDLGLNLYDFTARQYDAQIGRFWGIDPAGQFANGYNGMGNDPANMIDPTGCWAHGGRGQAPTTPTGQQGQKSKGESAAEDEYSTAVDQAIEQGMIDRELFKEEDNEAQAKAKTEVKQIMVDHNIFIDNTGKNLSSIPLSDKVQKNDGMFFAGKGDDDKGLVETGTDKAVDMVHSLVGAVILYSTSIACPIINQAHTIANEGLHEGGPRNPENAHYSVPYHLKGKSWIPKRMNNSSMTSETLSWEEGKEVVSASSKVVTTAFPVSGILPYAPFLNRVVPFIVKAPIKQATKKLTE